MPRSFRYTGKPCNIGRFGFVQTGGIVDLFLAEEESVKDNAEFEPVFDVASLEVIPLQTRTRFDLRDILWDQRNLFAYLSGQFKGTHLYNLAQAMADVGCPIEVLEHEPAAVTIDNIVREATRNGWHLLTRNQRRECPAVDEADPDITEEEWEPLGGVLSAPTIALLTKEEEPEEEVPVPAPVVIETPTPVEVPVAVPAPPLPAAKPVPAKPVSKPARERKRA